VPEILSLPCFALCRNLFGTRRANCVATRWTVGAEEPVHRGITSICTQIRDSASLYERHTVFESLWTSKRRNAKLCAISCRILQGSPPLNFPNKSQESPPRHSLLVAASTLLSDCPQ